MSLRSRLAPITVLERCELRGQVPPEFKEFQHKSGLATTELLMLNVNQVDQVRGLLREQAEKNRLETEDESQVETDEE